LAAGFFAAVVFVVFFADIGRSPAVWFRVAEFASLDTTSAMRAGEQQGWQPPVRGECDAAFAMKRRIINGVTGYRWTDQDPT
jgi:hypothetical protein